MSKRRHQTRTTDVFVPELDAKVTVRGPTDRELKGSGEDVSTPELQRRVLVELVGRAVVAPKLTREQVEALSDGTLDRICGASMRLHPQTALTLRRAAKLTPAQRRAFEEAMR